MKMTKKEKYPKFVLQKNMYLYLGHKHNVVAVTLWPPSPVTIGLIKSEVMNYQCLISLAKKII